MRAYLILLVSLIIPFYTYSQTVISTATTTDGRKVTLLDDGTWRYTDDSHNKDEVLLIETDLRGRAKIKLNLKGTKIILNNGTIDQIPDGAEATYYSSGARNGKFESLEGFTSYVKCSYDLKFGGITKVDVVTKAINFVYHEGGTLDKITTMFGEVVNVGFNPDGSVKTTGAIEGTEIKVIE